MHKEIGGYLEFENIYNKEYYGNLFDFNCSRNSLRFLIKNKNIKKIYLPLMNCDVVNKACEKENIDISFYNIDNSFFPILDDTDDYVYIVNYYGIFSNITIKELLKHYPNIILDNTHAFFQSPIDGVDTIYNCRKYFGVSDGSYLSTKLNFDISILDRQSSKDMYDHLLGRFEENKAGCFYSNFKLNDSKFDNMEIKLMSKITKNIMGAIDYKKVKEKRITNFKYLDKKLSKYNKLNFDNEMTYMYPLLIEDGQKLKEKLIEKNIFIPTLWPNVLDVANKDSFEYYVVNNIVLLPIDQRYDENDMKYVVSIILDEMGVV